MEGGITWSDLIASLGHRTGTSPGKTKVLTKNPPGTTTGAEAAIMRGVTPTHLVTSPSHRSGTTPARLKVLARRSPGSKTGASR